jgi:hypothetical protein
MKRYSPLFLIGAFLIGAVTVGRRNLIWEVKKHTHVGGFDPHYHNATEHQHEHAHVTHNRREGPDMAVGEWEHLTSTHSHSHNHPAIEHAHLPHRDAEHEHLGEAHIHDHEHPTVS